MAITQYKTTTYKQPYSDTINELIEQLTEQAGLAQAATAGRQAQIEAIFDEIIARYGPGGTYGAAATALLERQKVRDVGATKTADISRGLYGIRPYEQMWEAEVGAPARLEIADIEAQRLSQAQLGKAEFLERIEDVYPDYGLISQLISQASSAPQTTSPYYPYGYGGYGGYNTSYSTSGGYPIWEGQPAYTSPAYGTTVAQQRGYTTGGTAPTIQMGAPIYGTAEAQAAAAKPVSLEQEWKQFKLKNPYYLKTKEQWAKDRGYYVTPAGGLATQAQWQQAQRNLKTKYSQYR